MSCYTVWFQDAPSPDCLATVWLSEVSCLGTVVWLSTGTGDTGEGITAETSLLQELSWDEGKEKLLLLPVLLLSDPSCVIQQLLETSFADEIMLQAQVMREQRCHP